MKAVQYAVIAVVCALTFVGCRSMTGRSFGQQWDDKVISTQVKSKLTMDKFRNLFSTGVGTHFGVVHLTGNVATEAQRQEAERIAGRVAGVRQVKNELILVPRDTKTAQTEGQTARSADGAGPSGSPAASPAPAPMALSGQVTAINRDTGDVTVHTDSGDVVLRLPFAALRDLEPGQRLSITGQ
jgi:hyperosmotically inducible periplasmic protein